MWTTSVFVSKPIIEAALTTSPQGQTYQHRPALIKDLEISYTANKIILWYNCSFKDCSDICITESPLSSTRCITCHHGDHACSENIQKHHVVFDTSERTKEETRRMLFQLKSIVDDIIKWDTIKLDNETERRRGPRLIQ